MISQCYFTTVFLTSTLLQSGLESCNLVCCYALGNRIWEPVRYHALIRCPLAGPIQNWLKCLPETEEPFSGQLLHGNKNSREEEYLSQLTCLNLISAALIFCTTWIHPIYSFYNTSASAYFWEGWNVTQDKGWEEWWDVGGWSWWITGG